MYYVVMEHLREKKASRYNRLGSYKVLAIKKWIVWFQAFSEFCRSKYISSQSWTKYYTCQIQSLRKRMHTKKFFFRIFHSQTLFVHSELFQSFSVENCRAKLTCIVLFMVHRHFKNNLWFIFKNSISNLQIAKNLKVKFCKPKVVMC